MVVSAGMSVALYGAAFAVVLTLIGTRAAAPVARKVQVAFRPPPPPVEVAPPPPRPAPPPTVPKKMKVVEVERLPPPAPLVAPREVPLEKPSEAEPTGAPVAVASSGAGGSYGGASIAAGPSRSQPVHLPESASPPQPLSTNAAPAYPEEARVTGREGLVILKIVIDEEGRVAQAELMRGEEPFASAAMRAVRAWRYRPAILGGNPISIYRVVKVPFRLRG
jgi:protein TonB